MTHTYEWKNNSKRVTMYGRRCRIITRTPNRLSIVIEFEDGQREVVIRRAIRRIK
jgi:hypothetical protein